MRQLKIPESQYISGGISRQEVTFSLCFFTFFGFFIDAQLPPENRAQYYFTCTGALSSMLFSLYAHYG